MTQKIEKSFLGKIKERVDFIYNLLMEREDGYRGGFCSSDGLTGDIVRDLIARKIIERERDETKPRLAYKYKWAASMAPTNTLYQQVAHTIRETRKAYDKEAYKRKKAAEAAKAAKAAEEDFETAVPAVDAPVAPESSLAGFPSQELWSELKRRGYSIEDNRLVLIKKEYLE